MRIRKANRKRKRNLYKVSRLLTGLCNLLYYYTIFSLSLLVILTLFTINGLYKTKKKTLKMKKYWKESQNSPLYPPGGGYPYKVKMTKKWQKTSKTTQMRTFSLPFWKVSKNPEITPPINMWKTSDFWYPPLYGYFDSAKIFQKWPLF